MAALAAVAIGWAALAPTEALAFDVSGFAGGMLGGMIGSAMRDARPRPVIVYRSRPTYRVVVVPRRTAAKVHYAAAPRPRHASPAAAGPSNVAVVNSAADPFATVKPSAPAPIPVANKP